MLSDGQSGGGRASAYVCVVCVRVRVYLLHMFVCAHLNVCVCMHAYTCVHVCVCCVCVWTCVCVLCVCVDGRSIDKGLVHVQYIHIYTHAYICSNTYTRVGV